MDTTDALTAQKQARRITKTDLQQLLLRGRALLP